MAEYDLISKTALLKHLDMAIDCKDCPRNTDRKTYYERCACSEVTDICSIITDFATFADVQPAKYGLWIGKEVIQCSNCYFTLNGTSFGRIVHKYFSYCPNCGARMGGDTNG